MHSADFGDAVTVEQVGCEGGAVHGHAGIMAVNDDVEHHGAVRCEKVGRLDGVADDLNVFRALHHARQDQLIELL